ncbi:hypothetical protein ENUP19_0148G0003 [Entamoeba nuttalli]|uniref:Uncharacterized protein n=1 Tax=Entamoeba nuttalli TaxID=412467 RepID=A0ABQ0DKT2_9EUKA
MNKPLIQFEKPLIYYLTKYGIILTGINSIDTLGNWYYITSNGKQLNLYEENYIKPEHNISHYSFCLVGSHDIELQILRYE